MKRLDDILTPAELMSYLKIQRSLCYKLLNTGQIKAFKMGSSWKIPRSSVEEYVSKQLSHESMAM